MEEMKEMKKEQVNSGVNRVRPRLYCFIPALYIDLAEHTFSAMGRRSVNRQHIRVQHLVEFKRRVIVLSIGSKPAERVALHLSFETTKRS